MDPSPRAHHYGFAHRVLRGVVEKQPDIAFRALSSDRAGMMLEDLWKIAAKDLAPEQRVDGSGLRRELRRTSHGDDVVVIVCPPPNGITEAHFIAVVRTEMGMRYFTLEASLDFPSERPITVVCEWIEGRHLNFGPGPEATVDAFLDSLEPRLGPLH